jgi:hypothetical protein
MDTFVDVKGTTTTTTIATGTTTNKHYGKRVCPSSTRLHHRSFFICHHQRQLQCLSHAYPILINYFKDHTINQQLNTHLPKEVTTVYLPAAPAITVNQKTRSITPRDVQRGKD